MWNSKRRIDRFRLPNKKQLELLFRTDKPSLAGCYQLLWICQYGSNHRRCTGCKRRSNYRFTGSIEPGVCSYSCEYAFCNTELRLKIPFFNRRSKLELQTWMYLLLIISGKYDKEEIRKKLGISIITVDSMLDKLSKL